jgi:hypothetical protein
MTVIEDCSDQYNWTFARNSPNVNASNVKDLLLRFEIPHFPGAPMTEASFLEPRVFDKAFPSKSQDRQGTEAHFGAK